MSSRCSRALLGALLALAASAAPAHALDYFSVDVSGQVNYARKDIERMPIQDHVDSIQASFSYRTEIGTIVFNGIDLIGDGRGTTTITDVSGRRSMTSLGSSGACNATSGFDNAGGSIEASILADLISRSLLEVRTVEEFQINYGTGCSGDLHPHGVPIRPWDSETGHSPFDVFMPVTKEQLRSDRFEIPFTEGNPAAKCPGDHPPVTVLCDVSVTGKATFTRIQLPTVPPTTEEPTDTPVITPSPSPTATPRPTATPTPPVPAPAACTSRATARSVARASVRVDITCASAGTVAVALPKGKVLGRAKFRTAPSTTVDVRLSKKARRHARKAGKVRVSVTGVAAPLTVGF